MEKQHTVHFEEAYYLARYPDVANAVKQGTFRSGFDHYRTIGRVEERIPGRTPEISYLQNASTTQILEIQPAIVDGKSLEDLLAFVVKKRFEPLLRQYLEDNFTVVTDNMVPNIREMMDEALPTLLEQALHKELERVTRGQGVKR